MLPKVGAEAAVAAAAPKAGAGDEAAGWPKREVVGDLPSVAACPNVGVADDACPNVGVEAEDWPNAGADGVDWPNAGADAVDWPNAGVDAADWPNAGVDAAPWPNGEGDDPKVGAEEAA